MANDRERYAFNYYTSKGLAPHQAAGMTGNLIQESSLNTGARNPGDGRDGSDSIGIMQANGARARNLRAFAAATGRDVGNLDAQLDFTLHEMGLGDPTLRNLPGWGSEGKAGRMLANAPDLASATAAGISYERPAGWSAQNPAGGHGWENRYGHAARLAGLEPGTNAAPYPSSGGDDMLYGGAADDTLGTGATSNYGGLGGLGGMPRDSKKPFGWRDGVNALADSLMTAPAGEWWADTGKHLALQEARNEKRAKEDGDQQATEVLLRSMGIDADRARLYSRDTSLANAAISAQEKQRTLDIATAAKQRDSSFLQSLGGIAGDGSYAPDPNAGLASPGTAAPASTAGSAPATRDTKALHSTMKAADDLITITGSSDGPTFTASNFATGNGTVDQLMARRAKLASVLATAPSDDTRQNGKIILDNLDKQIEAYTPTAAVKEYNFAMNQRIAEGLPQVRYEVWKAEQSRAGANNVTIGGDKAYDQTVGKGYGDIFLDIQKQGRDASSGLGALSIMEKAMSNTDFYSGFGAEQLMQARRVAAALGADPEGVSNMETFSAQTKGAALSAMGGSLGAGFSNADRSFVEGQVPSIENTTEGNRKLIDINRKIAVRKQEIAKFARDYAKANGGKIDMGFDDALAQWAEANPLFPTDPLETAPARAPAAGPATSAGYVVRSVR